MNRFKFWRWGRLRRLGFPLYLITITILWTIINIGLSVYREYFIMHWTWNEIIKFQSQMILFILFSGGMIAWFTWDMGDEDSLKTGINNHVLETDRLILRKMNQTDFKRMYQIMSDPATMAHTPSPLNKDQVRTWIIDNMKSYSHNGFGRYVVELKHSGKIIGDAGFRLKTVNGLREIDLGYIIHADYWGNGYGYEATRACLEYGVNELDLKRIVIQTPEDQALSENIAQKLGMKKILQFNNVENRNRLTNLYVFDKRDMGTLN